MLAMPVSTGIEKANLLDPMMHKKRTGKSRIRGAARGYGYSPIWKQDL